ncbi:hypothetical protein [Paenibacillus thalictri]|uniref:Uncharacterized protein n=1 Tax=Paenibacillus thalictri TaxID=2527873 RepID=A0A4Q9DV53_9BACL|nr:hypothetical protein [Paenibacillus thalictri]TBL78670.1 hypothetical protein EYB31_14355 [Paenibacillus thalictri]
MMAKDIVSTEEMKALLSGDETEDTVNDVSPGFVLEKTSADRQINELVMIVRTLQSQVDVLTSRVRVLEHLLNDQDAIAEAAAASEMRRNKLLALTDQEAPGARPRTEPKPLPLMPRSELHGKKKKGFFNRGSD